ncbi:MAG: GNAT family N-acetyltransferase [Qingshengfaniella sp.]
MIAIRSAQPDDETAISILLDHAFEGPAEYNLIRALRASGDVAYELVATRADELVAHICFSRLEAPVNWLALAPVSVRPEDQGKGIGAELIRYGLDQARQRKFAAVVVVGGPAYYQRFGFLFPGERKAELSGPYAPQFTGLYPIDPTMAAAKAALSYPSPFEGA